MLSIFVDKVEDSMEVFLEDFSIVGYTFEECLTHLERVLQRWMETNPVLNLEEFHFMVKESIVLGQKLSQNGMDVAKEKIEVSEKLPMPISMKGFHSFVANRGF